MKIESKILVIISTLLISVFTFAQYAQKSKIISPERGSIDEFGIAVDIRGDFAISGTSRYNIAAGTAYIYAKNSEEGWSHHHDSHEMAEFGSVVKMTEDYIVVASGRADIENTIRTGALAKQPKNGQYHWELGYYFKSVPNDL
uniref:hypothetical protein n=1 Tax=Aequorivita sinensis TaxID=1382458 RepID=UPI00230111DA|nr:hypothetical protein [Aequorivita sinensis]